MLAAGGDEVSAAITASFNKFGQEYQALSAQAAAFHAQFVQNLTAGQGSYAATEAANVSPLQTVGNVVNTAPASALQTVEKIINTPALQPVVNVINAPTELLLGRPLIGNGAPGTPASPNGQAGGLLIGNGRPRLQR